MIVCETMMLSCVATILNASLIGMLYFLRSCFEFAIIITMPQIILSIVGTGVVFMIISILTTHKLNCTEPAIVLRR